MMRPMMRGRRMGRPGLIGTMARTAVVAGTASAVAGGVRNRQATRAEAAAQEQADQQATQQAAYQSQAEVASLQAQLAEVQAQQAPAAPGGGTDLIAELTKLGELKAAGVLSDEEFAAAKAKLLA
ncbi:SHOCT domain-containing protein [Iamia majanohamensis]|uniref:SHOCT domain-containing protein n=1 Tax=Iamia majanohamensis TaxID=467976 RepID=A0AAE9YGQ1_9ACTN|nr:SHOCT domain-containing protein [Iamia majanohamensis]WCO68162.1 SHOCT domain-containing protein [Iamia majanohamensis]